MSIFRKLPRGEIGASAEHEPYLPFPSALSKSIIRPDQLARPLLRPAGVELRMNRLPNHRGAGVIDLADRGFGAYDHVSAEVQKTTIYTKPSAKHSVDKQTGKINQDGLIVYTDVNGLARVVGWSTDPTELPYWEALNHGINPSDHSPGDRVVIPLWSLGAPELRVYDCDQDTGEMLIA